MVDPTPLDRVLHPADRLLTRPDAPREASRAVVTMCKAIAEWYNPAGPFTPEDVAERYVHFALGLVGLVDP